MSDSHDAQANALKWAVDLLRGEKERTPEKILDVAGRVANAMKAINPEAGIDVERLATELRHLFSVSAEESTILEDPTGHVPWYPDKRSTIKWRFWNRYMTWLERDLGRPPAVVLNLDELTSMILERLEDPDREAPWDRRGMIVGSVQSGKTANYIGLICKAIDAGYKFVIVLAGIHSNLRSQTQLRVDEGVLGFDTQKNRTSTEDNRWIGVGNIPGERLVAHSLTSSEETGDFNRKVADQVGVRLGSDPVVLVVKKNSKLLANLLKWVLHVEGEDDAKTKKRVVRQIPLLLIDDEADNASINTKAKPGSDEDTVTAINGAIRKLLGAFYKSAYVGYTATPFANIFINPDSESVSHGLDLFPRSFIINVKPPSNYVGPSRVFGIDGDPDAGIPSREGLPIIREIDDYATAFPPKHRKEHIPEELPPSLKKAIRCFILVCAARFARGQQVRHNSMLVHVTRFVDVQNCVVELIKHELSGLQKRIEFSDGERQPSVTHELAELWEDEFVPITESMPEDAGAPLTWPEIEDALHTAASKIRVMPINGFAKDVLDYKEYEKTGLSVIAVGGDKLSRGLTLEDLSISYFLRTTRMYDTLMQMGRWFGYRPGYLDLCRLFTTRTLKGWYRHIALAELELRREFDYMVDAGLTPENYGLRVRTHPAGMIVTAVNKMSHGRTLELSWAGVLSQTTQLPKDAARIAANITSTERLLTGAGKPEPSSGRETRLWRGVDPGLISNYVEALQFPPAAARASGEQLGAFIRKQFGKNPPELTRWSVALISIEQSAVDRHRRIGDYEIGLVERNPESQTGNSFSLKNANILNPADEGRDFAGLQFTSDWFNSIVNKQELQDDIPWLHSQIGAVASNVALELTIRWQSTTPPKIRKPATGTTSRSNGRVLRVLRPQSEGLLLIYPILPPQEIKQPERPPESTGLDPSGAPIIGIALSFPTSATTQGIEYRVNRVWGDDAEIKEDAEYAD